MKLTDFDYNLPKEMIAQFPAEPRDSSRLMVVRENIEHRQFYNITDYLKRGDTLVLNDSRVVYTKLTGKKVTGGRIECLIISKKGNEYECFIKGKKVRIGTEMVFNNEISGVVSDIIQIGTNTKYIVKFYYDNDLESYLEANGYAPLPPYIKQEVKDRERYQTIYCKTKGSIASPTAGLHFTKRLLTQIKNMGVNIAYVTLHVSIGTFTPVRAKNIEEHKMEPEFFSISKESARIINQTKGNIIACGTTVVKALESSCKDGRIIADNGFSDLFIYPSYKFKSKIDALITNFHLPRSTLLMLVSAYAGKERLMHAYNEAIANSYRFYSFGDSMIIFREYRNY